MGWAVVVVMGIEGEVVVVEVSLEGEGEGQC